MRTSLTALVLLALSVGAAMVAGAYDGSLARADPIVADPHRVLIVDANLRANGAPDAGPHRLLVVEIGAGKVVARADAGPVTNLAVSPDGDFIATLGKDPAVSGERLRFYQTRDLKLLDDGPLPPGFTHFSFLEPCAAPDNRLSPGGRQIVIQGPDLGFRSTADMADTILKCLSRRPDGAGAFKPWGKVTRVPRSYGVEFVRVADWPRVHIWNSNIGLLDVVDLRRGEMLSRLYLGDDPIQAKTSPADLERAPQAQALRWRGMGTVVPGPGRFAYYVPQQPALPRDPPGTLKTIDLGSDPPKVVRRGEQRQPGLRAIGAASAQALFVVKDERGVPGPDGAPPEASRVIKVFGTSDLKPQGEIESSLRDIRELAVSRDGKYLYALNPGEAKLVVIDAGSRQEVRTLTDLGKYPYLMVVLPEPRSKR
jgi:hypothetical protein